MIWLRTLATTVSVVLLAITCRAAVRADLVFINATVVDGSGDAPFVGDVAVRGDRIVAVGRFDVAGDCQQIDSAGLVIAPGFIDLHNHSDFVVDEVEGEPDVRAITAEKTRPSACYLTQGCTTIVTGNCGGGALDVDAYYDELAAKPPGVNVAQLIPQGAVRRAVIGETRRAPEGDELDRMRSLVERGMQAGAWGMTTGLQYVPSSYADTDELVALATVVGRYGGIYASHIRDEGDTLVESVAELIDIARRGGLPGHVSHFKASKRRNWGKVRAAASLIEEARAAGLRVTADQYPYAASSTSISAMLLPDEEREGGRDALRQRLDDPTEVQRLRPIIEASLDARGRIMVAGCPDHPAWVGRMIREIAQAEGKPNFDVCLAILRSSAEQGVSFSMSEADVRWVMRLPWAATASDGGVKVKSKANPHPRSFGTFPRKVGRFCLEEEVLPIEQAVRSCSGLPADILGLADRGYLRDGMVADLVVFDPGTFRDHATFQSPYEASTGVRWLLVNGAIAIRDGELANTAAGRPLRKPPTSDR
ncbi:MAG: D-aminoacylase [Planctomycetota bacterium]